MAAKVGLLNGDVSLIGGGLVYGTDGETDSKLLTTRPSHPMNNVVVVNGGDALSENELTPDESSESSTPMLSHKKRTTIEERVKRKAKRPSKALLASAAKLGDSVTIAANGHANGNLARQRSFKNSRRPRNGYGRGLPKKGGAGGKGTWGRPGIELMAEVTSDTSKEDPNYDSESEEDCEFESTTPELTPEELERAVDPVLLEYFEHGDTNEVILSLQELNLGSLHYQIVVMAVTHAMDRKPSHCEMTSILLSDLYGHILTEDDIAQGFDVMLTTLPDLVLDTPDAPTILGNFIARAIADDCIPPKFVKGYKGKVTCQYARCALEHADTLLSMKHGLVRLDNVWGVGGGMRPVKYLVNQIQLLLKEYLSSGDVQEATRCLMELEVPHFHHELVYEAVIMVIEDMGDRAIELMCKLLKSLVASVTVTPDQLKNGFLRVYEEMPEICIDVPPAYVILEKFVNKCHDNNFLPEELMNIPSRGRKRFVSEGDGGRIKEEVY